MIEKEKKAVVEKLRKVLETEIKNVSEFERCELAEEVLSDTLESVTKRLGELREEHEDGGD